MDNLCKYIVMFNDRFTNVPVCYNFASQYIQKCFDYDTAVFYAKAAHGEVYSIEFDSKTNTFFIKKVDNK